MSTGTKKTNKRSVTNVNIQTEIKKIPKKNPDEETLKMNPVLCCPLPDTARMTQQNEKNS